MKISVLLFLALLSISTSPIVAKGLIGVSAISIAFWRMIIASTFLWIYSGIYNQGRMKLDDNLKRTILAGILLGIHFALFFGAIKLTSIANATFLGTTAPIFTIIFEIIILKRTFNKYISSGLIMTLIGSLIILGVDFNFNSNDSIGCIMALLCSFCLGIAFIISEKVREVENTIVYTRTLYFTAAITLLVIGIIRQDNIFHFNSMEFLGLAYLGLVPTIIGHNSFYYSIKYVSPTIVAAFPVGEPVIATILAYLIFNESITLFTAIGGLITICGLIIISLKKKIK